MRPCNTLLRSHTKAISITASFISSLRVRFLIAHMFVLEGSHFPIGRVDLVTGTKQWPTSKFTEAKIKLPV